MLTGGCPLTRRLIGRWTWDYLAERFGNRESLTAHWAPRSVRRFTRFYGRGLGEGGVTGMSFKRFAHTVAANEREPSPQWRWYMQAPVVWAEGRGRGSEVGGQLRTPMGEFYHTPCEGAVAEDLAALDFEWLQHACEVAHCQGLHSCTLWAGHGGGATPMHFDALSNFFTQLRGRKQVLVFPPSQSFHVYPYPRTHPMDTYAIADVEKPDLDRLPALARARGLEATLEPGDVL